MQEKIKHEDLVFIQNTLWNMYRNYSAKHDAEEYTQKGRELVRKYGDNSVLSNFCENLCVSWSQVITVLGDMYRDGSG